MEQTEEVVPIRPLPPPLGAVINRSSISPFHRRNIDLHDVPLSSSSAEDGGGVFRPDPKLDAGEEKRFSECEDSVPASDFVISVLTQGGLRGAASVGIIGSTFSNASASSTGEGRGDT